MRISVSRLLLSLIASVCGGRALASEFPPQIKHVVLIVQENRTPDNLFHALSPACPLPAAPPSPYEACTPASVTSSCYDVSPCGISNQSGSPVAVTLHPVPLSGSVDPNHTHTGFADMCDLDPITHLCRDDGAWRTTKLAGKSYGYVDNAAVVNSDGSSGGLLDPYLTLARSYGWANAMYQTNQGPSYPAHQFIFSGTSAPLGIADALSIYVSENFNHKTIGTAAGCLAPSGSTNKLLLPALSGRALPGCTLFPDEGVQECTVTNNFLFYPYNPVGAFCYPHRTMADLLDGSSISWKYYAPSAGSIWTAPDSFSKICQPRFTSGATAATPTVECTGSEWNAKVDFANHGTDVLRDAAACNLANVSWVIPDGAWSDHAGPHDHYGPSWVASVINAIGNQAKCGAGTADAGETLWKDTAIIVTWDDWGGWSDHRPAAARSSLPCTGFPCRGDYELGFRVPLLVVSAYTPAGMIDDDPHDFGSILRMVEGINHIPEGALGFADARATTDLSNFFGRSTPRGFVKIPSEKDASFFLDYKAAVEPPDTD